MAIPSQARRDTSQEGVETSRAAPKLRVLGVSPADFHTVYGFRRPNMSPLEGSRQVCGLDYPFTFKRPTLRSPHIFLAQQKRRHDTTNLADGVCKMLS
jgi:hypothetical protein